MRRVVELNRSDLLSDCWDAVGKALRWASLFTSLGFGLVAVLALFRLRFGESDQVGAVTNWWITWFAQPSVSETSNGLGSLVAILWHGLVQMGLLSMLLAYPAWEVMRHRFGPAARRIFGWVGWGLAALILANPFGWQATGFPFGLNLSAFTYGPGFVLIGRAVDCWLFGCLPAPVG